MTASTGKRSFRACLRCRRRKTKCDLDGAGDRKEPPCRACHLSGNECILVQSKRGQWRNHRRPNTRQDPTSIPEVLLHRTGKSVTTTIQDDISTTSAHDSSGSFGSEGEMEVELRNPSDALEILARSDERSLAATTCSNVNCTPLSAPDLPVGDKRSATLEDFELLKVGVLQISVILELLQIYAEIYHPYCPLVPEWFFSPNAIEKISKPDHFLLTVLLTIASRDSSQHVLIHRCCWDYIQRLLLDVFLAHSSSQSPRTVEGLLLLAEWLPHIETSQTTEGASRNLFGVDRLAWSLVGLAIRQGYLLRLDRGAFRAISDRESKEQRDQKRLIWHFVCLADRHISVRLGQSFWSRGPSLSSCFNVDDFPSLKPKPGDQHDHAAILQANLELVQVLYNAHLILYASPERTKVLIEDGDYARYLDDFLSAATMWQAAWRQLDDSSAIHTSVFLTYEYVCLYVNAFSFQAVLTRSSKHAKPMQGIQGTSGVPEMELFNRGTMSSPDGLFINGAINAATKLLQRLNSLEPHRQFRYLPSRFFLYGIYAAVFLHKAVGVGAIKTEKQLSESNALITQLILIMQEAPATSNHVCCTYSKMLKRLWHRCHPPNTSSQNLPGDTESASRDPLDDLHYDIQPFTQNHSPAQPLRSCNLQEEIIRSPSPNFRAASGVDSATFLGESFTSQALPLSDLDEFMKDFFWPGIFDLSQPI